RTQKQGCQDRSPRAGKRRTKAACNRRSYRVTLGARAGDRRTRTTTKGADRGAPTRYRTTSRRVGGYLMRIVALDPGGTTGYVIYCTGVPGGIYTYGHLGSEDHHYKLRTLLEECAAYQESMYIVYERFDPRNNDFAKLISV